MAKKIKISAKKIIARINVDGFSGGQRIETFKALRMEPELVAEADIKSYVAQQDSPGVQVGYDIDGAISSGTGLFLYLEDSVKVEDVIEKIFSGDRQDDFEIDITETLEFDLSKVLSEELTVTEDIKYFLEKILTPETVQASESLEALTQDYALEDYFAEDYAGTVIVLY
jgi:hypothetical protein